MLMSQFLSFVGSLIDLKRPLDLLQAFHKIDHEKYNCHLKLLVKDICKSMQ